MSRSFYQSFILFVCFIFFVNIYTSAIIIITLSLWTTVYFSCNWSFTCNSFINFTAWKVSLFGVILVCIFPHSDWMRRNKDTIYSVFSSNQTIAIYLLYQSLIKREKKYYITKEYFRGVIRTQSNIYHGVFLRK